MRSLAALVFGCALAALALARALGADDASAGYEAIRPSLVKVWAFDRTGRPVASGTGIVVTTDATTSLVLTATHVVAGAASLRIDVDRDLHDLDAHVARTGPRDLTMLSVSHGNLHPARFAPPARAPVEGNVVAVAGYVKNDELIGVVGQEPRVLFPGTVSSRPDDGAYIELENVEVEEGLSGGPVFDPSSGEVLGIITSRTTDRRGGFADSGALVVLPFLAQNRPAASAPKPMPAVAVVAPPPAIVLPPAPRLAITVAMHALAPLAPLPLPPSPSPPPVVAVDTLAAGGDIVSWRADVAGSKRFAYVDDGCTNVVLISVRTLQFVIAHQALVPPHRPGALLDVVLRKRVLAGDTCAAVASTQEAEGPYQATAMSYDGRHVTMRFVFAGDAGEGDLFPADASLDANISGGSATATVQFFDRDWEGAIAVPLAASALAAVSNAW